MCVRVLCVCVCAYVWSQIEKEASWVDDAYSSDLYLTAIRVHSMWVASKKEVEPRLPAYALKNKTLWVMLFSSKISLVLQVNPSNQGHLTYVSLCVFCFVACLASLAIKFYLSWKAANLSVCTERFPFLFPSVHITQHCGSGCCSAWHASDEMKHAESHGGWGKALTCLFRQLHNTTKLPHEAPVHKELFTW